MRLVTTCQACQTKGNRHLHEKWHSLFDLSSCGFKCLYRLVQAYTRVYKQLAQRLMNVNEVNKTSLAMLWQGKACYWKKKNFKFYIESCNNNWWYVMFVVMLSPIYNHTFASVRILTLDVTNPVLRQIDAPICFLLRCPRRHPSRCLDHKCSHVHSSCTSSRDTSRAVFTWLTT